MPGLPKPRDQAAGEEARPEHGDHVPLDAGLRIGVRMMMLDHGERRRRHHEAHQRIGG